MAALRRHDHATTEFRLTFASRESRWGSFDGADTMNLRQQSASMGASAPLVSPAATACDTVCSLARMGVARNAGQFGMSAMMARWVPLAGASVPLA